VLMFWYVFGGAEAVLCACAHTFVDCRARDRALRAVAGRRADVARRKVDDIFLDWLFDRFFDVSISNHVKQNIVFRSLRLLLLI